jgi:hypothetical protein
MRIAALVLPFFMMLVFGDSHEAWVIQESQTTANLRGIHAVDDKIAWASGTEGTVLRTLDRGVHWEKCAVPPDSDKLDFRGVWAWDARNAMVMSAGPGELSRVYKTSDGCAHWTEETRNKDKDGFWDAMVFQAQDYHMLGDAKTGVLIGDPVGGRFHTETMMLGKGWFVDYSSCAANEAEAAFAASNSSAVVFGSRRYVIGTGGRGGPRVLLSPLLAYQDASKGCMGVPVPLASGSESSGVFSLAFRDLKRGVAVGGDYTKPGESSGTAAWTIDGGKHWSPAKKPPHGYRSSVAFDTKANAWIAAGTNGSDISHDGGATWRSLDDGNWNAISLPFVVGPKGRIARVPTK